MNQIGVNLTLHASPDEFLTIWIRHILISNDLFSEHLAVDMSSAYAGAPCSFLRFFL